jgi:fluoroacetyl-CoA thioesterase
MIEPGRVESAQETVTEDATAEAMGSGDVPVLATPAILATVERLAVASLADALPAGTTTVGARVELDHLAPTPVGALVSVTVRLVAADGRRLTFEFEASDPNGAVARGTHLRVAVEREAFLDSARARAG